MSEQRKTEGSKQEKEKEKKHNAKRGRDTVERRHSWSSHEIRV